LAQAILPQAEKAGAVTPVTRARPASAPAKGMASPPPELEDAAGEAKAFVQVEPEADGPSPGGWRFKKSWSLLLACSAVSLGLVLWCRAAPAKPELAQLGPEPDFVELLAAWQQDVLEEHNTLRAKHGADALSWSNSLARDAATCLKKQSYPPFRLDHCGSNGQNIAAGAPSLNPATGVTRWYDEIKLTPGEKGEVTSFDSRTGHYTQVVWKNTKKVGCARNKNFLVCDYSPPGNYRGQYGANVIPLGTAPEGLPDGPCADLVPAGETRWHDSDGHHYHCDWYAQGKNCQQHGTHFKNFGYTATKACCACGGGQKVRTDHSASS